MMLLKEIIGLIIIETTLFFAIFFLVKCHLIFVKYLIKFGTKYVWIYLFQPVMWLLTSH